MGIIIAEMGALYKYGLLIAVAHMVLAKLHVHENKYRQRVIAESTRTSLDTCDGTKMRNEIDEVELLVEEKVNKTDKKEVLSRMWGARSEYTGILDLLIRNSGVDDCDNARVAFRNRKFEFHGFNEAERSMCENDDSLLRQELSLLFSKNSEIHNDINNGNGEGGEICNIAESENTDFTDFSIPDILTATEDLLEAIAVMKLTECYSDPPLINGVALKNTVLKNIPRGNVFGEVRTLCVMRRM